MHISFRKFVESDIPLFLEWAGVPHVKNTWFQEGYEPKEKISEKVQGNGYDYPFIIEVDGRPIGYMQYSDLEAYYRAHPEARSSYYGKEPPGTVCVDLFIADATCLGKGYGTEIVRKFSEWLLEKPEIKKVVIDPSVRNKRAIRCYEKAGFVFDRIEQDRVDVYHVMDKYYRLRKFQSDDAVELYAALQGEKVVRHMASEGITLQDCETIIRESNAHWRKYHIGSWAVVDGASNTIIGWAGFKKVHDLGFELLLVLSPSFWGAGKAIVQDLMDRAKNIFGLDKLYILLPESRKKFRFIQKLGFVFDEKMLYAGEPFLRFVMIFVGKPGVV